MSAPHKASGEAHPLARPFLRLCGPRTGLYIVIALGVVSLAGFALEFLLTEEGLSKYPEALGAYEILPFLAVIAAVLAGWLARWVLGRRDDYYEHAAGDFTETDDA